MEVIDRMLCQNVSTITWIQDININMDKESSSKTEKRICGTKGRGTQLIVSAAILNTR
jgi:hypothetical protein